MNDRIDRINILIKYLGITKNSLALSSGLGPSNLNKMLGGEHSITDKTLHKICDAYPQINVEWLKTGEGEMIINNSNMQQNNNTGNTMMANSSHHLSQGNNSEEIFEKFISGLKSQAVLTERSMDQTDKALEMMNRLITILEDNNQKYK